MVNENERGLACIMCATPQPRTRSRTTAAVAAAAAASLMVRAESNDRTVRYDRGDEGHGARGAASSPRAPSRMKAIAAAPATASSMPRAESNDGNDGTVRYDRGDDGRCARGAASSQPPSSYASSSSTLSATTTTLKREWSLADVNDTKKRLIGTSKCPRSYTPRTLTPDPAPTLTMVLKKRSALASVANPYERKKKSKPLSGKENLGLVSKNTNDVKSSIAEMEMKPRAVSLSPEDTRFELHYPRAHGPIKSHGDLFFKITGVKAYSTTCPPEEMLEGLVEDGYTKVFGGHYAPPHEEGNPNGYDGKDGRALDHTTFLTERAFIRSLPKEFQ